MIEILRKSWVALLVLALALIAQIPHAAHVFDRAPYLGLPTQPVSLWYAWLLAYAYAIALESATLMFVVHGHQGASYGFALASFAVNLSYYAMHGVALWSWASFPAWLLSALLPIAIASYSHILAGVQGDKMTGYRMQWLVWLRAWWASRRQVAQPLPPAMVVDAMLVDEVVIPMREPGIDVQPVDAPCNDDVQPDPKEVAKQLKSEGLSNAQIASQLGVNPSTVSRWMNGAKVTA